MTEKAAPPRTPTLSRREREKGGAIPTALSRREREGPAQREGEGGGTTSGGHAYRVRLPGFVRDQDIGLGDAVTRATSLLGIRPCGGCEGRAAALNRWMVFSGRHSR
jgi:hypothetical protein